MKLVISKSITFIPEFNGNKKEPATDQISVEIKNPTIAQKNRLKVTPVASAKTDTKGNIDHMEISVKEEDPAQIVTAMVEKISGLSYESGGKEEFIKTGADLAKAPVEFEPLLKEIADKCKEILEAKIDEKN